jgi:hypothetical protein
VSRQMPNNEASRSYDKGTDQLSIMMVISTIYTLLLGMVLSKAVKKMIVTLFSLQVIIHMFFFTIPFPGNIINVIKKIKPIVSFNLLKSLSVYVEKYIKFDTLAQIEMQPKILAGARTMGIKQMNAIVNLKQVFFLLMLYLGMCLYAFSLKIIHHFFEVK